jgi:hypothetical protein
VVAGIAGLAAVDCIGLARTGGCRGGGASWLAASLLVETAGHCKDLLDELVPSARRSPLVQAMPTVR